MEEILKKKKKRNLLENSQLTQLQEENLRRKQETTLTMNLPWHYPKGAEGSPSLSPDSAGCEHHLVRCIRDFGPKPWVRQAWSPRLDDSTEWAVCCFPTPRKNIWHYFGALCHLRQPHHSFSFCLLSVTITITHIELSLHSRHGVDCFVCIFSLNWEMEYFLPNQ